MNYYVSQRVKDDPELHRLSGVIYCYRGVRLHGTDGPANFRYHLDQMLTSLEIEYDQRLRLLERTTCHFCGTISAKNMVALMGRAGKPSWCGKCDPDKE